MHGPFEGDTGRAGPVVESGFELTPATRTPGHMTHQRSPKSKPPRPPRIRAAGTSFAAGAPGAAPATRLISVLTPGRGRSPARPVGQLGGARAGRRPAPRRCRRVPPQGGRL